MEWTIAQTKTGNVSGANTPAQIDHPQRRASQTDGTMTAQNPQNAMIPAVDPVNTPTTGRVAKETIKNTPIMVRVTLNPTLANMFFSTTWTKERRLWAQRTETSGIAA